MSFQRDKLSKFPRSPSRRVFGIKKGLKFSVIPHKIPAKNIVATLEAAITKLPKDEQDSTRTITASLLCKSRLPNKILVKNKKFF